MGTRLKEILVKKGIKQTWLAEQAGITYTTLSFIVRGKTEPTLKTARKIARALGMTIEELWPEEESQLE